MFRGLVAHSPKCSFDKMRTLFSLFSVFVAFLWAAGESTTVPTGNRTLDRSVDKSALAAHLEIDEPDTPRILGLRDPANFGDDYAQRNNEERGFWPSMASTLADVVRRVRKPIRIRQNTDPAGAQLKEKEISRKLRKSISHLESLMGRSPTTTTAAAVQVLGTIDKTTKRSVVTLIRSRGVGGMQDIAYGLLRALAVKYKDAEELVLTACLKAGVHPEEVFYMLPVYEKIHTRGLQEPAAYSEIDEKLELFLQYNEKFYVRQMKKAGTRRGKGHQSYVDDTYGSESFVVETLMKVAKPKHVVAYFEHLREKERLHLFAEKADRLLLAKYQVPTESLMLRTWAEAGLSPCAAIKMMPWSNLTPLQYRVTMGPTAKIDIRERFKQVLKYVRLYREHRAFDDDAVAELLHDSVPIEELWAYIMVFERYRGEDELSTQLYEAFVRISKASKQELNDAIGIENNLLQGYTPWSIPT